MKVHITGTKAVPIIKGLGGKENYPHTIISSATVEGHEAIPLFDAFSVKTGKEPLINLPSSGGKCSINKFGHQIAKLTHGEPTKVYDMNPDSDPNRHFACQDHYNLLPTIEQLKIQLYARKNYYSFIATDMETGNILFEKPEGD